MRWVGQGRSNIFFYKRKYGFQNKIAKKTGEELEYDAK